MPEGARSFLGFMERRYACKRFDPSRPIERELVDYLIECCRLSPASFGLEHCRLLAVESRSHIASLAEASGSQIPVATAPLVFVLAARRGCAYEPDSELVRERSARFPGGHPAFKADYQGYYEFLAREGRLDSWARAQCYIALGNLMTGAAAAGLDSCAIEGFDEGKVLGIAGLDAKEWMACLLCALGYADEARRERYRLTRNEMSGRL